MGCAPRTRSAVECPRTSRMPSFSRRFLRILDRVRAVRRQNEPTFPFSGSQAILNRFLTLISQHCRYLDSFTQEVLADSSLGAASRTANPPPEAAYQLAGYVYAHMNCERFAFDYTAGNDHKAVAVIQKSGFYIDAQELRQNGSDFRRRNIFDAGYHREFEIVPVHLPLTTITLPAGHMRNILKENPIYVKGVGAYSYPVPLIAGKYELYVTADTMHDATFDVETNFIELRVVDSTGSTYRILEPDHRSVSNKRITFTVAHDLPVKPGKGTFEVHSTLTYSSWAVRDFRWIGEENAILVFFRRKWKALGITVATIIGGLLRLPSLFD